LVLLEESEPNSPFDTLTALTKTKKYVITGGKPEVPWTVAVDGEVW
jgi:hypothetical protein